MKKYGTLPNNSKPWSFGEYKIFKNLSDNKRIIPPQQKNITIFLVEKYLLIFVGYLVASININNIIRRMGKVTAINFDAIAKYIPGIINKLNSILWFNSLFGTITSVKI
jgi:uncharacterized protein with von Willebrand factor type A (vWA) domain